MMTEEPFPVGADYGDLLAPKDQISNYVHIITNYFLCPLNRNYVLSTQVCHRKQHGRLIITVM